MPDKFYLGNRAMTLEKSPRFGGLSKIRMLVDDNTEVEAGTDGGYCWEIDSPWATQEQAAWLLARMQGYDYQPYRAEAIQLDPAAETGDYVTVGGVYGGIFNEDTRFGKMMTAEIAAPQSEDIDHEAPFQTASERKLTRLAKSMAAEFRVQADQIAAKVSQIGGDNNSFGWEMTVNGMHWYANGAEVMKCTQAGLEVYGHIKGGTIEIGSGFSVDELGNMTANNATLTGTLNVGGTQITAATLRSGAASGYNWANGSYGGTSPWQYSLVGGGYGYNFNSASQLYTSSFPSYFRCGMLQLSDNTIFSGSVSVTINGTQYRLLGFVSS